VVSRPSPTWKAATVAAARPGSSRRSRGGARRLAREAEAHQLLARWTGRGPRVVPAAWQGKYRLDDRGGASQPFAWTSPSGPRAAARTRRGPSARRPRLPAHPHWSLRARRGRGGQSSAKGTAPEGTTRAPQKRRRRARSGGRTSCGRAGPGPARGGGRLGPPLHRLLQHPPGGRRSPPGVHERPAPLQPLEGVLRVRRPRRRRGCRPEEGGPVAVPPVGWRRRRSPPGRRKAAARQLLHAVGHLLGGGDEHARRRRWRPPPTSTAFLDDARDQMATAAWPEVCALEALFARNGLHQVLADSWTAPRRWRADGPLP